MMVKSIDTLVTKVNVDKQSLINVVLCSKTIEKHVKLRLKRKTLAEAPRWFFPTLLNAPRKMGVSLCANMSAKKFH